MVESQQQEITRLVELGNELRHLICEHDALKCQLSQLQSTTHAKPRPDSTVDGELRIRLNQTTKQLNGVKEQLNRTRQQLSDVRERLTVAVQVTAATQQRELEQSDNDVCQLLQLATRHQSTTDTGNARYISLQLTSCQKTAKTTNTENQNKLNHHHLICKIMYNVRYSITFIRREQPDN